MATETSSKHDHMSCKDLIQSGSPAIFQLRPKKETMGTLRTMTLGKRNSHKINKTILLVGETGTGKSKLINALVNYAMGVKWEDDVWFQIVEEEESQSESQTSDVMVYQIFGFEGETLPYSLTIIDTPGFGDTTGTEQDVIVSQRLFDLFCSKAVHQINAVGLVLKASENRLSDRLRYIFESVVSLFGKDMEKNIVALITHSDGRKPTNVLKALKNANFKCARNDKNQPVHFQFNNCQEEDRSEEQEELQHADKISMKGMSQFTDFLEKTPPQKLEKTVHVLIERIRLAACINNLQERIEFVELKQEAVNDNQERLNRYKQEMEGNKGFTIEVEEVYKVKRAVNRERRWWWLWLNYGGAVCCTVCEENCHYPCTLTWYPEYCEVIKDGRCTVCTGKCPESVHVKEQQCLTCEGECRDSTHKTFWIYTTETRTVQKTEQQMKEKYEKGKAESEESTDLLENLKKEIEELQKEKDECLEEAYQHVLSLEKNALNANSLSTHVHLDFLIEKMKEKGDKEKVQKLEEMKKQMDEDKGFKAAAWYGFGKTAAKAAFQKVKQTDCEQTAV
ncbi:uncharacterized protein LOC131986885 [Centropristis striata]|uniref:uncharacterized protein LOC131986885 n=1 Tax=Centropristis striata TaxID=184440 RepID=UPI0027E0B67B|nr:uncharacterized protein LOC131986885 [Centropristis striata]